MNQNQNITVTPVKPATAMQAVQQAQQQQQFDPTQVNRDYTPAQWKAKEDYYIRMQREIVIPETPSPQDVTCAAIKIDALLSIARMDYAYAKRNYDEYDLKLKTQEKVLFVDLKLNPPIEYNTLKLTVDEMKGVVAKYVRDTAWNNSSYTLHDYYIQYNNRYQFMDQLIKVLADKKDLLITHSGILKIENSLSSISNNATTANYQQQQPPYPQ